MLFGIVACTFSDNPGLLTIFLETQEKNNGFPFLDILGYLKNTHKNPKFERVGQVPIRELGWEFPGWELSHFVNGSQY